MTLTELRTGYQALTQCIDEYIKRHNVKYVANEDAPDKYELIAAYYAEYGVLNVSSVGNHGLLGEAYNVKFRACHDHGHLKYELDFSVKDECELAYMHSLEFRSIARDLGFSDSVSDNVYKIIQAEVREQRLYYARTGKYVDDQEAFVRYCLIRE